MRGVSKIIKTIKPNDLEYQAASHSGRPSPPPSSFPLLLLLHTSPPLAAAAAASVLRRSMFNSNHLHPYYGGSTNPRLQMGPWLTNNASQPQHGYGNPVQAGQPVYAAVRGEYMAHTLLAHPFSDREIQLTPDQTPHFNHHQQQQYKALLAPPPPAPQQQSAPQLPQRQPQQQQQMSTASATATPATAMAMTPAATTLTHTADYIVTVSLPQWPTLDLIYYPNGSVHVLSAGQGKGQLTAPKLPLAASGTRTTAAAMGVVGSGGDGSGGGGGGGGVGAPRCSIVQDAEVTQELRANGELLYSVAGGSGISLCEDLSRRGFSMGAERRCPLGAVVSSAPSGARRTAERRTTEDYEWRDVQPVAAEAADGDIHDGGWETLYRPTDGTTRPPLVAAAAVVAAGNFDPHLHTLADDRDEPVVVPSSSARRDKVCYWREREREREGERS